MSTTRETLSQWFDHGIERGASHMAIVCDTFDHTDSPYYLATEAEALAFARMTGSISKVMEIYCMAMDKTAQMAERRAWNIVTEPVETLIGTSEQTLDEFEASPHGGDMVVRTAPIVPDDPPADKPLKPLAVEFAYYDRRLRIVLTNPPVVEVAKPDARGDDSWTRFSFNRTNVDLACDIPELLAAVLDAAGHR